MTRSSTEDGGSNPSQAVRLLWFFLIFLSPAGAVAYVTTYKLEHGNEEALIRVLAILAVSLMVSLFCAIAQPIQCYDEIGMTRAGRASLCLAIFDTIIFVLLMHGPSSVAQACELASNCRTYPVIWLALAGMHYCHAVWTYATGLICSRWN
jgi:hypothetical protein